MYGFIKSLSPLYSRYKIEIILLGAAFLIGIVSLLLYFQQSKTIDDPLPTTQTKETRTEGINQTITVDISGAIKNPFVYTFRSNARIIDLIQKAGGLTEDADEPFVKRNVNYARILTDQEKIYIPYLSDTANGYVLENKRVLDYSQPNTTTSFADEVARININVASALELDQLPGIGKVNSDAIFNGRPYTATEDLVKNNIIKQSVYEKIKDLISVY